MSRFATPDPLDRVCASVGLETLLMQCDPVGKARGSSIARTVEAPTRAQNYCRALKRAGFVASMSRKGDGWDNVVMAA